MITNETPKTALAPAIWGTLYILSTEVLPQNNPLFIATMRALPVGLVLFLYYMQLLRGAW